MDKVFNSKLVYLKNFPQAAVRRSIQVSGEQCMISISISMVQ